MIKLTALKNPSRITKRDVTELGDGITMSRSIYQRLGSLVGNKHILEDYNEGKLPKEFVEFLDACRDININKKFPNLTPIEVASAWSSVDEYLGDLGNEAQYYYSKDTIDIAPWLSSQDQPEYRVLTDEVDNTYLTTNNGTEVLVYYTGAVNG